MLTGIERKMYDSFKHHVKVTMVNGDIFTGYCDYYVPFYDNDPEVTCIALKNSKKNGQPFPAELLGLDEPEIEDIELLD